MTILKALIRASTLMRRISPVNVVLRPCAVEPARRQEAVPAIKAAPVPRKRNCVLRPTPLLLDVIVPLADDELKEHPRCVVLHRGEVLTESRAPILSSARVLRHKG